MPRALWSGSISFGMVNIPVKLYVAVRDKQVHFHMIHREDGMRLHRKMVCPEHGEVPDDEVVKGYEIGPDKYVVVSPEELESVTPEKSRTIEITDFVDMAQIDPVYFQKPYYLLPEEQAAKAYSLLVEAMEDSGKVAVARFVMHDKEYLAALRPIGDLLCLETMHFADEIVAPGEFSESVPEVETTGKELEMAGQLIEALSDEFEPEKYHDEHREELLELIEKKVEGQQIVKGPQVVEEPGKVVDLMSALEESLEKAKKKRRSAG